MYGMDIFTISLTSQHQYRSIKLQLMTATSLSRVLTLSQAMAGYTKFKRGSNGTPRGRQGPAAAATITPITVEMQTNPLDSISPDYRWKDSYALGETDAGELGSIAIRNCEDSC
jgi:hypothetical protein